MGGPVGRPQSGFLVRRAPGRPGLVGLGLHEPCPQDPGVLDGLDIYVERVENTRILRARLVKTEAYEPRTAGSPPDEDA